MRGCNEKRQELSLSLLNN